MSESLNSINKSFKADTTPTDTEMVFETSLDLTGQPAGMVYFNQENNYNYNKNWFNYGKLHNVGDDTIINELVQYGYPTVVPDQLDQTKTYSIPSSSLSPVWAARIENESGDTLTQRLNVGFSGIDASGNVYVVANYRLNSTPYSSNNVSAASKTAPGVSRISLTKYNSSGIVQWTSRITCPSSSQDVFSLYMVVDKNGRSYILGQCLDTSLQCENSSGTVIFNTTLKQKNFIAAYDTNGSPAWLTFFGRIAYASLAVDDTYSYLYLMGSPVRFNIYYHGLPNLIPTAPQLFFTNTPTSASPSATGNPAFALGKQVAYGTTALTTVSRSAGGVATLTFNSPVINLGLNTGVQFSLLGLSNDNNSFNVTTDVFTITSTTTYTISYTNSTGTMPYASTASTGIPLVTILESNAAMHLIQLSSTNGSFSWATYVDGSNFGYTTMYTALIGADAAANTSVNTGISTPLLTVDPTSNLIVCASYFYIKSFMNVATASNPIFTKASLTPPPIANTADLVLYEEDRNWIDIACEQSLGPVLAAVKGGYLYTGPLPVGNNYARQAFVADWSCVAWNSKLIAAVNNGPIYYASKSYTDPSSNPWYISSGEGAVARKWVAIGSNDDFGVGRAVAVAEDAGIYYSTDGGITWYVSNAPNAKWSCVAWTNTSNFSASYNALTGYWLAMIKNGQAYRSTDADGSSWVLVSGCPSLNWKAVAGWPTANTNGTPINHFYMVVENGPIYAMSSTYQFTIVDYNIRKYSDIKIRSNEFLNPIMVASVDGGAIYVAREPAPFLYTWFPITIPGDWNAICMSTWGWGTAAAFTDRGGKIYKTGIGFDLNSFMFKIDRFGVTKWTNYTSSSFPISVTTQPNGNIVLHGKSPGYYPGQNSIVPLINIYSSSDFEHPIKIQGHSANDPYPGANRDHWFTAYNLVCYTGDGMPIWNDKIRLVNNNFATPDDELAGFFSSMTTDAQGNIYCITDCTRDVFLYNPNDQYVFGDAYSLNTPTIVKYYPDGHVQSFTRILTPSNWVYNTGIGTSIRAIGRDIYISGRVVNLNGSTGTIDFRTSPGSVTGITEPISANLFGVYVAKYTSGSTASINFPPVLYNAVFNPQFTVGGSTRQIIQGSIGYGPMEIWGGQTGLDPSMITLDDVNAGVISYLGHEPGYSIPLEYGIQTESPVIYRYLSAYLSEPSFPENDPQPVTTGTIPYGYLPTYISFPFYATGLTFNNALNSNTNLVLSATGTISGPTTDPAYVSFSRSSSQFMSTGSTTLNISTNGGFTAIAYVRFTGTAGGFERVFEFASGTPNDNVSLNRNNVTTQLNFTMNNGSSGVYSISGGTIVQNAWTLVTCRYTASTTSAQLFQNGILVASQSSATLITNRTTNTNFIGRSNYGSDAYTNMDLAGLLVYDRSLSNAEITTCSNILYGTTPSSSLPATPVYSLLTEQLLSQSPGQIPNWSVFSQYITSQRPVYYTNLSSIGLFPSGVSSGDRIRFVVYTSTNSRYIDFTVKGLVVSSLTPLVYSGIMFEENSRYLSTVLGTTETASATLISVGANRYLAVFYVPSLFKSGSLNVDMLMYPKQQM